MMLRLGLVAALSLLGWSCSDDDKPQEAVAVDGGGDGKVPDAPGGAAGATGNPQDQAGAAAGGAYGTAGNPQEPVPAAAEPPPPAPGMSAPTAAAPAGGSEKMVKVSALNVRKGPGTKNAVVRTLKKGEKVQTYSCTKSWCKIGEGEYVSKKFLK